LFIFAKIYKQYKNKIKIYKVAFIEYFDRIPLTGTDKFYLSLFGVSGKQALA